MKKNQNTFYLILLCHILLVYACGKSGKKWESKLIEITEDKKVTLAEYKTFKDLFQNERGNTNEKWCAGKGKIDSTEFIKYLKAEKCKIEWEKAPQINYHIYVDGSELTKGYIKKAGMSKTMNGILYEKIARMVEKNKVKLCMMNSEGECTKEQFFTDKEKVREYLETDFSTELNKTTGLSSLFHRLLPKLAEKANQENLVIMVSDFITSNNKDNAVYSLEMLKGIDIHNKSFYFVGYEVDFNGAFWFSNNRRTNLQTKRPFYILFIGAPEQIIQVKKMGFWKDGAIGEFISISEMKSPAHVQLLKGRNNLTNAEANLQNKEIKIKKPKDIKFTFEVTGLEELEPILGENYLTDKNNYKLSDQKYLIEQINIEKEGEVKKYRFTVINSEPNPTNLQFSIKINSFPEWVKNNSLNITDEEKEKTKTFGLYELITNLAKNNENTLQLFSITIKD